MSDTSKSSATTSDPLGSAKANLRDTLKWLTTTFSAIAAIFLAGTSFTGISGLDTKHLVVAVAGGAFGLLCILAATGMMLRLLTSELFFLDQLRTDGDLLARLEPHVGDVLPPEIASFGELLELRAKARKTILDAKDKPSDPDSQAASVFLLSLDPVVARVTSLAHFAVLVRNLERAKPYLILFALGALLGLGTFAVASGRKGTASSAAGPAVTLGPDWAWSVAAQSLASNCGPGPFQAQIAPVGDLVSWSRLKLVGPGRCAGAEMTIPPGLSLAPEPAGALQPARPSQPRQP